MVNAEQPPPTAYIIAGPNGAGKSSAAPFMLASRVPLERYVNPDAIALAINPDDPYSVRRAAGVRAISRLRALERARLDLALETTLSGKWTTRTIRDLIADAYVVDVTYLWLPSAEDAVARVRFRVEREGGHFVPEEDVRRRFDRSLVNFEKFVRPLATRWRLSDAREPRAAPVIAEGSAGELRVRDADRWASVRRTIEAALAGQLWRNND